MIKHGKRFKSNGGRWISLVAATVSLLASSIALGDPFPPHWNGGAVDQVNGPVHFAPVAWPSEPADPALCGETCGEWKPYTRFQSGLADPRVQDPSNGGTAPQNYVNIASSCIDKALPSVYYSLKKVDENDPGKDVIMFRWRVEQIANNYATGPNAGSYGGTDPWSSALWTVLFDVDGSGYRSLAAHLNGSSGGPSTPIDMLAGIYGRIPTQSIDYNADPVNIKLLGHNPTAFIDGPSGSNRILNFAGNPSAPTATWPNGSSESTWDYGTSRARLVTTRSCNEYFVDYQIPVALLDATAYGGPKITRSTPISMLFCTANSLNNPFQKDCALNRTWIADPSKPAPFGDYISFDQETPYSQPIIREVKADAPATCQQTYNLAATVQDTLAVTNGVVGPSVKAVSFWYYYDADGDGVSNDGSAWTHAADATLTSGKLNQWQASWDSSSLPKGRYLIGVQAVDDRTLVDDDMPPNPVDNRTFSYVTSNATGEVYIDGQWTIDTNDFPSHSPTLSPSTSEDWYGNPAITGVQVATAGVDLAINACGVAPTLSKSADKSEVGPGEAVSFTLTVSNADNPGSITVSSISDVLPAGFSYQAFSTSGDFGSIEPGVSGQTLTWTPASPLTLAPDGSVSLSFVATASTVAGNYNNLAHAVTSFGTIDSDPVAVAVGSARLSLTKTPASYTVNPGGQVSYTLSYSNPTGVTIADAVLTDPLPANTSLQSCTPTCTEAGGSVTWNLGSLAGGASGSVTLVLTVDPAYASTSLANTASVSGTDPGGNTVSANAASTVFVNVPVGSIAAFTLEKTASAVQVAPGGSLTYTIAYSNYGGAAAANAVITDVLPAGMSFVSCTGSCSNASGTVTWSLGSVAAGASGSVTVTVSAASPFTASNPVANTASIAWDGGGPVTSDATVGVSGQSCSAYYFRDATTNVGFDGSQRTATTLPVPLAGDTGASVTVVAPNAGQSFLEAVRFYQDPATGVDTEFSGNVTSSLYIDRSNGPGLDVLATLYDYNSADGTTTQLGQQVFSFGGNTKGLFSFDVPVSGTLAKNHRLQWMFAVRSQHNSQTYSVQIQYNGTVTNAISGGTTFANSGASFCVTPPANLTIDKVVDLPTVDSGVTTNVTYTIAYANTGSSIANSAQIVDTLPAGVSFASATLNSSPITPTGSNPYTFAIGDIAAAGSGSLVINATVSNTATGLLTNSASIESQQTSPVSDTASTLVGAPGSGSGSSSPELSLSKSASKSLLGADDSVTYTLTVVNTGGASATNVVVSDDFPDQAYFSYGSCSTATGSCSQSGGSLTWTVGTLAAGQSATLSFTMTTPASGLPAGVTALDNTATAADDDYCTTTAVAGCTSETVTVSISGNPDLALSKTASQPTLPAVAFAPGDEITYTLVVTNNGSAAAADVKVYDPIPASTSFVSITQGSGSFDAVNNRVVFDVGSLAGGASATLAFKARVVSTLAAGSTSVLNTATASAGNSASRTAQASSLAAAEAVMTLSKSGPASVPLPAATLAADADNATTLTVASAALLAEGDYIRVGGTIVRITAIAGNAVTVDAAVTASSGAAVQVGASWSMTYQNDGDAAADSVAISDPLPAGWLYAASSPQASAHPAVGSNGTVSWTIGTVAAGAGGTVQVVAIPTQSGTSINSATLTATGGISEQADATTLVGGLVVTKATSTPVVSVFPSGALASYTITLSNSLGSPVSGVTVTDLLAAGFTYHTDSASVGEPSFDAADSAHAQPIWSNLTVPANGTLVIEFDADVAADTGTATYQNEVDTTAPAGVGVTQFDALSTTAEDVTVLGQGTYVLEGYVFRDAATLGSFDGADVGIEGVRVEVGDNSAQPPYVVHTDGFGYFRVVLPAGTWSVSVPAGANATPLNGLRLWDSYTLPLEIVFDSESASAQTVHAGYVSSSMETPAPALSVVKTAYEGHTAGASCPGDDPLVVVDSSRAVKDITWCFAVTNNGNTYLASPVFDDSPLGITPSQNQASVQLRAGSTLPLAPGATAWWYVEESRNTSLENAVGVEMSPVDENGVSLGLDPVQGSDTGAVFAYVFDPPFGIKTGQLNGQDVVRWTMVWINDSVITANGVVITDPIPEGMSFLGNLTCTPRGSTVVTSCVFEDATTAPPRGRVRVVADIGPDPGATGEADAANELLISFDASVQPSATPQSFENQGFAEWDVFGDDSLILTGETYDPVSSDPSSPGPTGVTVPPSTPTGSPTPVPALSPLGLLSLALLVLLGAGMGRRRLR